MSVARHAFVKLGRQQCAACDRGCRRGYTHCWKCKKALFKKEEDKW